MSKLLIVQPKRLLSDQDFNWFCEYIQTQKENGLLILNADIEVREVEVNNRSMLLPIEEYCVSDLELLDYNVWISENGTSQNISSMARIHIVNCITKIVRSLNQKEAKRDDRGVYNYDWTMKHGEKYIKAFTEELVKRNLENK